MFRTTGEYLSRLASSLVISPLVSITDNFWKATAAQVANRTHVNGACLAQVQIDACGLTVASSSHHDYEIEDRLCHLELIFASLDHAVYLQCLHLFLYTNYINSTHLKLYCKPSGDHNVMDVETR